MSGHRAGIRTPLFSGLIGGLIVSRLNGSQLTISGPTADLIVTVFNAIETLGTLSIKQIPHATGLDSSFEGIANMVFCSLVKSKETLSAFIFLGMVCVNLHH